MSRIANAPIKLPKGVEASMNDGAISVKGSKGDLDLAIHHFVDVAQEGEELKVSAKEESRQAGALAGTFRALINNMVVGVTQGFSKELQIIGVGYQAQVQGQRLQLQLGYSHEIIFDIPEGITVTANRTEVKIDGIDKQLVGAVAAKIRSFRPPEPYKGKGIRYKDEYVRSKQGKTVGAK